MSDLKVVVVGAGFAGRVVHLPGYRSVGQPVAAICDLDTNVAQNIADQFAIENVYSDWREMIEKERPDVVSVCLPNVLHYEITIGALEAGAHVLCEKPLATTVQQAHEMFDKAREKGKLLMAAQLYRHDAAPRALKRIVETGVLGDIYHAESNAMRRLARGPSAKSGGCSNRAACSSSRSTTLSSARWTHGNSRSSRAIMKPVGRWTTSGSSAKR